MSDERKTIPLPKMTEEDKKELQEITKAKDVVKLKEFIAKRGSYTKDSKIEEDIGELNNPERVLRPIEVRAAEREKKEERKRTPKIKVADRPEEKKQSKNVIKPSTEQIHVLVHTVTRGVSTILNKEEISKEEAKPFSDVLYDIGEDLKWWDTIEFLPYLILVFSGIDLTLSIMKKPSKSPKHDKIVDLVTERVERVDSGKPDVQFDMVDEDALIKKLGGANIYGKS